GFHVSSTLPAKFLMNVMCEGRFGLFLSDSLDSSGVLSPFLLLHFIQAVTRFSHVSSPPLDRGIMWSTVRLELVPQYWHLCPSRRRMFLRERIIFLKGTFTKNTNLTTLG